MVEDMETENNIVSNNEGYNFVPAESELPLNFDPKNELLFSKENPHLWNIKQFQESIIKQRRKQYTTIRSTVFSGDGQYLIAGTNFGSLVCWNISKALDQDEDVRKLNQKPFRYIDGISNNAIHSLEIASEYLFCGTDSDLRSYLLADLLCTDFHESCLKPRFVETLPMTWNQPTEINKIVINQCQNKLYLASGCSDIYVFDLRNNVFCGKFVGHKKYILSLLIDEDANKLISGSDDGTIRIWDLDSYTCTKEFKVVVPENNNTRKSTGNNRKSDRGLNGSGSSSSSSSGGGSNNSNGSGGGNDNNYSHIHSHNHSHNHSSMSSSSSNSNGGGAKSRVRPVTDMCLDPTKTWLVVVTGKYLAMWHLPSLTQSFCVRNSVALNSVQWVDNSIVVGGFSGSLYRYEVDGKLINSVNTTTTCIYRITKNDTNPKVVTVAGKGQHIGIFISLMYQSYSLTL